MLLARTSSSPLQRAASGSTSSCLRRTVGLGLPALQHAAQRGACQRRAAVSETAAPENVKVSQPVDAFVAAASRLKSLLNGVGDGEGEFVDQLVSQESPESKLQTSCMFGAILTIAAVVVSLLCGKDPWGGASLSMDTLYAGAVGAAFAVPLVALRSWSWSPAAYKALPPLQDMHIHQVQVNAPWFSRMSRGQAAIMMALEVLPLTLLLLPAAQGGIAAALEMYSKMIHYGSTFGDEGAAAAMATQAAAAAAVAASSGGPGPASAAAAVAVPHVLALKQFCALAMTAGFAGLGKGMELGVAAEEYDVVRTAMENSDRYYRVMALDSGGGPSEAQRASIAFKSVSLAWLQMRNEASAVAGAQAFLDVLLLGGIWYATGNLAAPAVAALAVNWVDYHHTLQVTAEREAKAARHDSGSGSNGGAGSSGGSSGGAGSSSA